METEKGRGCGERKRSKRIMINRRQTVPGEGYNPNKEEWEWLGRLVGERRPGSRKDAPN